MHTLYVLFLFDKFMMVIHHSPQPWDFSNYGRAPCRPSHPRSMDSSASECLRNLMDVTKKGASTCRLSIVMGNFSDG